MNNIEDFAKKILKDICPDFKEYNFLKTDLYKASLFGGANLYLKVGKDGRVGMVTGITNEKKYSLEKFEKNFETVSMSNKETGWTGETLINLLIYLTSLSEFEKTNDTNELESQFVDIEGRKIASYGFRYERKPKLRKEALKIHGYTCVACNFNFEEKYGKHGKNYIEIHHVKPLSENDSEKMIDPKKDLVPVCANCHRMIHREKYNTLSIDALKKIISQ